MLLIPNSFLLLRS